MGVALYGWKYDGNDYDIYEEDIFIGEFETYEEACEKGNELIKKKILRSFDTYVL